MRINPLPPLPLYQWDQTKMSLHLRTQIVGKIRLALTPPMNHWWHAALYVTPRGLTTGPIPHAGGSFDLEFDFLDHQLVLRTSEGAISHVDLREQPVAGFYNALMQALHRHGIDAKILAKPYDIEAKEPFDRDSDHAAYDVEFVERFHRALVWVDNVLKAFRGRFVGKCSPVHFFWHSFDLAVTRFSGKRAPQREGADPVTREAYSHEVISAGFWPGDERLGSPAFYAYAWPEPEGLHETPLRPGAALWQTQPTGSLALMKYDDIRTSDSPQELLLEFLQSTYDAAADLAGWDRAELERMAKAEPRVGVI